MGQVACGGCGPSSEDLQSPSLQEPVYLHLYHLGTHGHGSLLNRLLNNMGAGVYHCGVEVFGKEWSFADTVTGEGQGVFECVPRRCKGHTYDETVLMGHTLFSEKYVLGIIELLRLEWQPADYHLLEQNCCHFTDSLARRLGVRGVPDRIFIMCRYGEACIAGRPCVCNQSRACEGAENIYVPPQEVTCRPEFSSDDTLQPMCHLPVLKPEEKDAALEWQGSRTEVMHVC